MSTNLSETRKATSSFWSALDLPFHPVGVKFVLAGEASPSGRPTALSGHRQGAFAALAKRVQDAPETQECAK